MSDGLIFVDFDGVLVTPDYQLNGGKGLDPAKVLLLNQIIDESDARIVVTSSWRGSKTASRGVLGKAGLLNPRKRVIGVTPTYRYENRGYEIYRWLVANDALEVPFAILDDDTDMDDLLPRLVRTNPHTGLTVAHVPQVLELLKLHPLSVYNVPRRGTE